MFCSSCVLPLSPFIPHGPYLSAPVLLHFLGVLCVLSRDSPRALLLRPRRVLRGGVRHAAQHACAARLPDARPGRGAWLLRSAVRAGACTSLRGARTRVVAESARACSSYPSGQVHRKGTTLFPWL